MKKINISIFTGGSGNIELARNLCELNSRTKNISINFLINGYDDGKSTGFLRQLVPGMLGPSDFRKNCSNLILSKNQNEETLKKILDYRIKDFATYNRLLLKIKKQDRTSFQFIDYLPWNKYFEFIKYIKTFDQHLKTCQFQKKKFKDISLGNILFTSFYLSNNKKFNHTIKKFSDFFEIEHNVLNITNGENFFLSGLAESGNFLKDEVSIIENKNKEKISDIFLLKKKLNHRSIKHLESLKDSSKKKKFLNKLNFTPKLNPELNKIIKKSDIIIYGPGTQNSSLYPSYLTKNIKNILMKSKAKKIFISNIFKDKDIVNETTNSIIEKFFYYMNDKKNKKLIKEKLIDYYFVHKTDKSDINNIRKSFYLKEDLSIKKNIFKFDWEKSSGVHFSNLIVSQIFKIINKKSFFKKNRSFQTLSIILPCLNEKNKIKKVLREITSFRFSQFNLSKEIILVDGGSTDGSIQIAKKFRDLKIYSLNNKKRGECIDFGIQNSKGDIIVVFPSDGEYAVSDIENLVSQIYLKKSEVVYGSRLIKNLDPSKMIRRVYGNNIFLYYLSKFGGIAISAFTLILYNRFLADPLTTLKCFNAQVIKNINIKAKGVNYDIEQFLRLYKNKIYVDEQPVSYKARSYRDGKKTSFLDGLGCITTLIKYKFFSL